MSSRNRGFLLLLIGACVFPPMLMAEIVKEVGPDGKLTMEDGKQVFLAGVEMDTEGISVLRVLVQKQDLRLQWIVPSAPEVRKFAYAYLRAKYLKFPAKPDEIPGEKEILINEFLVKLGAAKVAAAQDFSHKAKFLKIQEESKKKGEGIWSYEGP